MTRDLTGKRAIVTGASGGIGRAVAKALAIAGAKVAVAARSTDKLTKLVAEITAAGGTAVAVTTDVTVPADRERLVAETVAAFGGVDLLVNNAGVASWGHFSTSTEEINRRVLEVNFFGPVELARLAVPHLTKGNQPLVVNLTSMCGRRGMPAWPEYSASKAALVGISEAWRGEFARFGIDVLTVVPGLTKTDLNTHLLRSEGRAKLPFDSGMTPETVAAAVVRAIQKDKTEIVLGGEAKKILLLNRFAPRFLNWRISREIKKLYAQG
ncbi:MAG: SDR family NAD(P)-dependent oxidoreductase [Fimbriiglobus sp.]